MAQFEISKSKPIVGTEQETILVYDKGLKTWHFYTDNPVHARKWEAVIVPREDMPSRKVYHETTGDLIGLEGDILGNVSISKKRKLTEEQKNELARRMGRARSS
ncbi:hypothetical protein ACXM1Q_001535 [Streptococcus sp. 10F2]